MKQVLLNPKSKQVTIEEIPPPLLKDAGVLIQVHYSLISTGTELASLRQPEARVAKKLIADKGFAREVVDFARREGVKGIAQQLRQKGSFNPTGYSGAGIVIDVGSSVTNLAVGDSVAYAGASHAEIVYAPKNFVAKLPPNVHFREGVFTTLGSIAMQGIRKTKVELGETILVIGLGLVGQLANQLLQVAGCHTIGSDLAEWRLRLAQEFGLQRGFIANKCHLVKEVLSYTNQIGVDAVIICAQSASSEIINQATKCCRRNGRVVVVGDVGLNLQRAPIFQNELSLTISRAYGPGCGDTSYVDKGIDYPLGYVKWTANRNMEEFAKEVSQGKLNVDRLISKEFDISNVQDAYEILLDTQAHTIAVLLRYEPIEAQSPTQRKIEIVSTRQIKTAKGNIKVALIGAGGISKGYHLPNLQRISGAEIYAIVSGTGVNAKKIAKQYHAQYCTTDYKEVLVDKEVDCVLIATRHNLHKEMIVQSAKAGKHIYVEKPMAMNYEDVREIVKVVKESDVIMTVGTCRRCSELSAIAKEAIKDTRSPVMINYRMNSTLLPMGHWVNDPVEGGGRIIGEACHYFDFMYWLLDSEPVTIYAEQVGSDRRKILPENNVIVTIKFANGSIACLAYCDFGSGEFSRQRVEIMTGGKAVEIDGFREIRVSGGIHKKYHRPMLGLYEQLANFIEVLQGKKKLDLGLEDGARSTICALKVLDSLKLGKPVKVNVAEYL